MSEHYEISQGQIPVSQRGIDARSTFITRTYNHLMGAIVGFTLFEVWLFTSGLAEPIAAAMLQTNWLLILGGFMIATWFATRAAHTAESPGAQYAGLAGTVVAYGIMFVPLLYMANSMANGVIQSAATVTLLGFGGLTAVAFTTRKDFSFLGGMLRFGFVMAMVAIVSAVAFGFHLGTWFSVAMVAVAGGAILYDTSNVLHHYPEDRHVAAATQLFASVALMFWYILQIFMSRE